ncbi:MAG: UPF0755 protein [Pseudohongiellaceae bacterium]|jgi:UPF0755 protein
MKYLPHLSSLKFRLLITVVVVAGISCLLAFWLAFTILHTPLTLANSSTQAATEPLALSSVIFEVGPGSSLGQVSRDLESLGLFSYPRLLILFARIKGAENSIKVGEYELNNGLTAASLIDKMVAGETLQYRVTLVEGWTFNEALDAIQGSNKIVSVLRGLNSTEMLAQISSTFKNTEGILFPDTYFYTAGSTDLDLVRRASARLEIILQSEWEKRLGALPYKTPYEALIMASIIEKESAASSERGHISGVFIRRLELGMRLQSDPTVIYGMGETYDGDIRKADLQKVTLYNTYRVNGLPPTPIALPGFDSIHASLNPESSNYLYFVAQSDGSHYFSSSLQEHNQAVARLINRN